MSLIQVDRTERVVWVTLNRPPLNILNLELLRELGIALDAVRNESAAIMVLDAAPGSEAFSGGIDVTCHTPENFEEMLFSFHSVLQRLLNLPQVTVAAVDNSAFGGGFELALACDMAVASEAAEVGFPEIKLACFPPAAIAALPTLCSRAMTSDLILTGSPVTARRAMEIGLISRVFPRNKFSDELADVVAELSARSPAVLKLTVGLVRRRFSGAYALELAAAERAFKDELAKLPDMVEGVQAFLEKREPQWED